MQKSSLDFRINPKWTFGKPTITKVIKTDLKNKQKINYIKKNQAWFEIDNWSNDVVGLTGWDLPHLQLGSSIFPALLGLQTVYASEKHSFHLWQTMWSELLGGPLGYQT